MVHTDSSVADAAHLGFGGVQSNLVPKGYTVEQYREERTKRQYSIDVNNPDIQSCEVANKNVRFDVSDPIRHPFS